MHCVFVLPYTGEIKIFIITTARISLCAACRWDAGQNGRRQTQWYRSAWTVIMWCSWRDWQISLHRCSSGCTSVTTLPSTLCAQHSAHSNIG